MPGIFPESNISRRQFLTTTAQSASWLGAASTVLVSRQNVLGANERLGVGFIGVGGRGMSHVNTVKGMIQAGEAAHIVAVSDTWRFRHEEAARQTSTCASTTRIRSRW